MKKIFFGLLCGSLLFFQGAQAAELILTPALRSYPTSGTIEARARHEFLIWDQRAKSFWQYGFVQPQMILGAHGLAEVSLSLFPVSILELGVGLGTTSRFYKTKPFDCDLNVCQGVLRRERLTLRGLGGVGEWLGVFTLHRIKATTADESKPFVDETEVLAASPGQDTLETASLLLGKKLEDGFLGVFVKKGRYLEAGSQNEFQYLVYRRPFESFSSLLGVGRYASDFTQPGPSVYATLVWTWGKSLALF